MFQSGFMNGKKYNLNKMTLGELVVAYFQYYAIQAYLVLGIIATVITVKYYSDPAPIIIGTLAVVLVYPLVWYILHRFVLHGSWMYKSSLTAKVWKRIHYDHHQDPHDLGVLFGALYTTLPTILVVTVPIGWGLGGIAGAGAATAAGMFMTCFYEFTHCIQHLSYKPKNKTLDHMKKSHMAHHFHDEDGNYGITNFMWDKLFNSYYERKERPDKSPTVFNLGYDEDEAEKYPWVKRLSGGLGPDTPRARRKEAKQG